MDLLIWIGLVMAAVVIFGLIVLKVAYTRKKRISPSTRKKIMAEWRRLEEEHDHEKAIIGADKLLDFALGERGITGNLGEKLKKSEYLFSDINGVWRAHKLRNGVAHEVGRQISSREFRDAMIQFKKAILEATQ